MVLRRALVAGFAGMGLGLGCGGGSSGIAGVLVVANVAVSPSPVSVVVGSTVQLAAEPKTASGLPVPGRPISWTAAGGSSATVSATGLVTAVAVGGPMRVRATVDGVVGEALITVSDRPVATVTVTPSPVSIPVGQFLQLTAQAFAANGDPLPGQAFTWQSSAPATVGVTTTGIVLAQAPGGPVSVTAMSDGVSGTAAVTAVAAPASKLGFTTQPPNGVAGQPLTPAVRVAIQNLTGGTVTTATNPVTVAMVSNQTGAVVLGTVTVNAVAGVATFSNLRIDRAGTGYRLEAISAGLSSAVSGSFAATPAVPASLAFATAPPTAGQSGVALTPAPAVQVLDRDGAPVREAGIVVTVALQSGGGAMSGTPSASTNAGGVASFGPLTITGSAGNRTLRFGAGALLLTSAPIAIGAGAAIRLTVTTQPSGTAVSGQTFVRQPVVQLRDGSDNPVSQAGVIVTVTVASGTGALGGTLTVGTGAEGAATFSGLLLTGAAGTYSLGFQASGVTAVTSENITVTAGSATQLTITTQPAPSVASGAVMAPQPVLQLRDASGNPVAQGGVIVSAAIASGAGPLGGTTAAVTNASGAATFSNLSISGIVGARTLAFTSGGLTGATSAAVIITPGAPNRLAIITQPSASVLNDVAFPQQPELQVRDGSGNDVSLAGVVITGSIASGGGILGGILTAATGATGRAAFTNLKLTGAVGARTLNFTAPGLPSVVSAPVTVTVGPAIQFSITTQPAASAASGQPFVPQPVLQLRDALDNPVGQAGVNVSVSIAGGGGTLGGPATVATDASGAAVFVGLNITGAPGNRTLSFQSPPFASLTSTPIALTVGPAAQLTLTTQPASIAASGAVLAPQPVVQLRDGFGSVVALAGVSVTVTIATGGGNLGGTTSAVTNGSGLATFATLSITGVIGARTLAFASTNLTGVTSGPIAVTPGPPSRLAIATPPPATAPNDAAFLQQPAVQLTDASGNDVGQAGVVITAAIATGGGTLGGTAAATSNATGRATFGNLKITGTTGVRTLRFAATGFAAVESAPVTITAGAATGLALTTPPPATASSGVPLGPQPVIQLRDISGNPVSLAGVVVVAARRSGSGTLSGVTSIPTNAGGAAVFTNLTITGTGNHTVRFTSGGLTRVTSATINVSNP